MSAKTRKVKNPFNSYFAHNLDILTANDPDLLTATVREKGDRNLPNINAVIERKPISGIEAYKVDNKKLEPAQRAMIVEYALTINNKYAVYDIDGVMGQDADERLPHFMAENGMKVAEPSPLPPVGEIYRLSKGDLFSEELVTMVANNLAKPINVPDPAYDLRVTLSDTILLAAARLRVESFICKGMVGDLILDPHVISGTRISQVYPLIQRNAHAKAVENSKKAANSLLAENAAEKAAAAAPKQKKKQKQKTPTTRELVQARLTTAAAARAEELRLYAAREAARVPDGFLNPSITTLNEEGCITFIRTGGPRLNARNKSKLMMYLSEINDKEEKQYLLKLKRLLLIHKKHLAANLNANRNRASKGGSAAKALFQERLESLRRIRHLVSYRAGFQLSKRNCEPIFSPLANCIAGEAARRNHRRQIEEIRENLREEAKQIVQKRDAEDLLARRIIAIRQGRNVENIEMRLVKNASGKVIRQYVPRNEARSAMTLNRPDLTVDEVYARLLAKHGLQ